METKKRLTPSIRKHIRLEKAFIRRNSFDLKKQEEAIANLYKKYSGDIMNKEVEQQKPLQPKKETPKKKIEKNTKKHEVQKNKAKRKDK